MPCNGDYAHSVASTSAMSSSMGTRRSTRGSRIGDSQEAGGASLSKNGSRGRRRNGENFAQPAKGIVEVTDNMVENERNRLLIEKQTELDRIFDRHDDLVREKFHMLNWRTMLAYDPLLAKGDKSQVFQEFKMEHDLFRAAEPATGPSRRTRQATTERKLAVAAFPSVSAPPASLKRSKLKPNNKNISVEAWRTPSVSAHGNRKEKGREVVLGAEQAKDDKQEDTSLEISLLDVSLKARRRTPLEKSHRRSTASSSTPDLHVPIPTTENRKEEGESIPVTPRPLNGLKRPRLAVTDAELPESASQPALEKREKKQKHENNPVLPLPHPTVQQPNGTESGSISVGRTLRQRPPNTTSITLNTHKSLPAVPTFEEEETNQVSSSPENPAHNIKRIKLIVRKPVPSYTNPQQCPQSAKFDQSLPTLLSSYAALNPQSAGYDSLQRKIKKEAAIREQESNFRRQGRFIPGTDVFFGTKVDPNNLPLPYQPPKRESTDIWDSVVESVVAQHKLKSKKPLLGNQVTGQITARVQAYWDAQGVKKDKARLQEEKRLRGLAKSTVKMVVSEWKRAVQHIREQKRLKAEEEERRRGHEHLDAILDQSGQLLSTQQTELKRGEKGSSRASSVRFGGWGEDSDDESDEGEGTDDGRTISAMDDEDDAGPSEDGGEEDNLGANSTMLLMEEREPSPKRSLEPPEQDPQSSIEDDEEEAETSLNRDNDEGFVTDIDFITIPDPESSPIQPTQYVLTNKSLVHDPSLIARSPTAAATGSDIGFGSSRPPSPEQPRETGDVAFPPHNLPGDCSPTLESIDLPTTSFLAPSEHAEAETEEEEDPQANEVNTGGGDDQIPEYLKPYAVAPVERIPNQTIAPLLLRGALRPYQQSGLEWLASLHSNNVNGILADEMGLGKTIQTIALLAHLACDRGIWGPHLIVVPTSVLLNWEMEFKKFLPSFKVLSYHGSTKRRKDLRQGWMDKYHFNVCITSYTLASRDQHVFKRKPWYYMILDEAHMIKNFRSQRWSILLMFRSFRRLLLTGTPLQNNLTELWALLQFLMSGSTFANLKEFGDWFSNPLEKAIEMGQTYDEETLQRVSKLHTVLRPYLLRRLKRDVEKELPTKYEHLLLCPLSQRQRFLYDEFMSRAETTQDLQSGVYQKIANILMQLRKVCNHPDLFEVRPIVTSFAMQRSAIADFEIKELLVRQRWLEVHEESVNLDVTHFLFTQREGTSGLVASKVSEWEGTSQLPYFNAVQEDPPPKDTRTVTGFLKYAQYQERVQAIARWSHIAYLNRLRCSGTPLLTREKIDKASQFYTPIFPLSKLDTRYEHMDISYGIHAAVMSYEDREAAMAGYIDRFAFATPAAVALDIPRFAFPHLPSEILSSQPDQFDHVLHRVSVKLQIAFPDPSLLQYDCGKLQKLAELLRDKKQGGHRVLIFTQMTRILDILEMFLSFHGYLYLRLDGATKIEDRQYITERFNADPRVFCFISSSRSGGVGINLTGADTVVFYDSDFNPQMDRQCEDRAHRIGQIRDVHIYRFVSQHTVEEAMLRKANQKRSLDDLVIQRGEFDWRSLFNDENALTKALGECDDVEDALAAALAAKEAFVLEGADEVDFGGDATATGDGAGRTAAATPVDSGEMEPIATPTDIDAPGTAGDDEGEGEEGGTTVDYMVTFVELNYDFFRDWKL